MGIAGLATFLSASFPRLGKFIELCSSENDLEKKPEMSAKAAKLIVDGNSFLYYVSKEGNWLHSPCYADLSKSLKRMTEKLSKNSIFIFDGALPLYKIETRHQRNNEKVELLGKVFKASIESSSDIYARNWAVTLLPPFAVSCAVSVLKALGFNCIFALQEADNLIAHHSNVEKCPILSLDSDFFLLNTHGYIPLDSVNFNTSTTILSARIYKRAELACALGIKEELLAIVAALGGSDYFTFEEMNTLLSQNQGLGISLGGKKFRSIIKILKSMGKLDYTSASKFICKKCTKDWQERVNLLLLHADQQYNATHLDIQASSTEMDRRVVNGLINPKILEIVHQSTFYCNPFFPDHPRKPSNWDASSFMRQVIYRRLGKDSVIEFKRCGGKMQEKLIKDLQLSMPPEILLEPKISCSSSKSAWDQLAAFEQELLLQKCTTIYDGLSKTLEYLILYHASIDPQSLVGNHEIASSIITAVLLMELQPEDIKDILAKSKRIQPTANTIMFYGSLEATLFTFSILVSITDDHAGLSFFKILDGALFFLISEKIRRGRGCRDLFKSKPSAADIAIKLFDRTSRRHAALIEEVLSSSSFM